MVVSTDGVPATGVLGVSATAVIGTDTVPAALEYVPLLDLTVNESVCGPPTLANNCAWVDG